MADVNLTTPDTALNGEHADSEASIRERCRLLGIEWSEQAPRPEETAIALLTGAVLTLVANRAPIPRGHVIGKYMLQGAIVMLGLKLDITALWETSADFAGLIAIYVIGALAVGIALGFLGAFVLVQLVFSRIFPTLPLPARD